MGGIYQGVQGVHRVGTQGGIYRGVHRVVHREAYTGLFPGYSWLFLVLSLFPGYSCYSRYSRVSRLPGASIFSLLFPGFEAPGSLLTVIPCYSRVRGRARARPLGVPFYQLLVRNLCPEASLSLPENNVKRRLRTLGGAREHFWRGWRILARLARECFLCRVSLPY